jgi:hypothetical protein
MLVETIHPPSACSQKNLVEIYNFLVFSTREVIFVLIKAIVSSAIGILHMRDWWLTCLSARLLAAAALWFESRHLTNKYKMSDATSAKEWPTHSSPPKNYTKNMS